MVAYLAAVVWWAPSLLRLWPASERFLVWVGCLSSWAKVSHYMCHTTNSGFQGGLARLGVVLGKSHHSRHHAEDNLNYAFLNGWTDPVLNRIAKMCNGGYKRTTDLHDDLYEVGDRS